MFWHKHEPLIKGPVFRPPFEYQSAIQTACTMVPGIWIANPKNPYSDISAIQIPTVIVLFESPILFPQIRNLFGIGIMSECPLSSSSRIFFDVNDETVTGRLHPTDIATLVSTSAGRDVFMYDISTLVERGIYNIGFAHEKEPGTHQKKLMASRVIFTK